MGFCLKVLVLTIISFMPILLFAVECDDWIKHLAQEHHVSIINKSEIKSSNFRYFDLSNSPYRIAIPQNEEKNWNIETRALPSGATFSAYNQAFGYSAEFDSNGNCLNSTGFGYDNMDRTVTKSLQGKNLEFNYDWKACEKVSNVAKKNTFLTGAKDYNQAASTLKKTSLSDYDTLERIAKSAGSSPLKRVSPSSVAAILSKCMNQTEYLEATVKKSTVKKESSNKAMK